MKPIAPLMIEHRLIERMLEIMRKESAAIEQRGKVNIPAVEAILDFIVTYIDRCHHAKEEDILFYRLNGKSLSAEHRRILNELIDEHRIAMAFAEDIDKAMRSYAGGESGAVKDVSGYITNLTELYPKHIDKEDKEFFIPVMSYFSPQELAEMLDETWEFDRKLIHEKYRQIVEEMENQKEQRIYYARR